MAGMRASVAARPPADVRAVRCVGLLTACLPQASAIVQLRSDSEQRILSTRQELEEARDAYGSHPTHARQRPVPGGARRSVAQCGAQTAGAGGCERDEARAVRRVSASRGDGEGCAGGAGGAAAPPAAPWPRRRALAGRLHAEQQRNQAQAPARLRGDTAPGIAGGGLVRRRTAADRVAEARPDHRTAWHRCDRCHPSRSLRSNRALLQSFC